MFAPIWTTLYIDNGRKTRRWLKSPSERVLQPSMMAEISENQYANIMDSNNTTLKANTFWIETEFEGDTEYRCFVIGEGADRYQLIGTDQSAERYTRGQIGVVAAAGFVRMFKRNVDDGQVFACYPPVDRRFKSDLINAVKGSYRVTNNNVDYIINIVDVMVEAEPIAALYNMVFNQNGTAYDAGRLKPGLTITLDGGGRTWDTAVTDDHFNVMPDLLVSDDTIALNDTIENFKQDVQDRYHNLFRGGARSITDSVWYQAFISGQLNLAGKMEDVSDLRDSNRNSYANSVQRRLDAIGGLLAYSNVNLTGGWSLAFKDWNMPQFLRHNNVLYTLGHGQKLESDILFSQVLGLYKMSQARKSSGR